MVAVPAPPAPSGPKPASFAAAASGGAGAGGKQASISAAPQGGAQQRGPYGGGPGPRAGGGRGPQQQVPAAMPQGMPYPGQAGLVYMQPGFPAQQQYAMAYLPGGGSYFAGANYQQPQYSGYPIGAPGAAMQPPMHAGPQQPRGPPASMPAGAGPPSGPRPMAFGGGGPPAAAAAKPALPAAPRQRKVGSCFHWTFVLASRESVVNECASCVHCRCCASRTPTRTRSSTSPACPATSPSQLKTTPPPRRPPRRRPTRVLRLPRPSPMCSSPSRPRSLALQMMPRCVRARALLSYLLVRRCNSFHQARCFDHIAGQQRRVGGVEELQGGHHGGPQDRGGSEEGGR